MGFWSKLFGGGSTESAVREEKNAASARKDSPASPKSSSSRARAVDMSDLEGFVEFVAKALVDYPDEVCVRSEQTPDGKMIKIFCRAGDRGKIIGKKGKTIMALRSLVAGAAGRTRERISVEVPDEEPEAGKG